jgi:hypothetical protein
MHNPESSKSPLLFLPKHGPRSGSTPLNLTVVRGSAPERSGSTHAGHLSLELNYAEVFGAHLVRSTDIIEVLIG